MLAGTRELVLLCQRRELAWAGLRQDLEAQRRVSVLAALRQDSRRQACARVEQFQEPRLEAA